MLPVRVLIVDDSLVVRSIVERYVSGGQGFEVAASLGSAHAALDFLKNARADIILLDVEMPGRSGLDALPEILAASHGARVLVLSSHCAEGAPTALKALALGASDTLAKPDKHTYSREFGRLLLDRLSLLSNRLQDEAPQLSKLPPRNAERHSELTCIAIGASTGGIIAMHEFLTALDPRIDAPILITQHLPETFIPYLVRQINDLGLRQTLLAEDGLALERSTIYLAPGHAHLCCRRNGDRVQIALCHDWPGTLYRPAVDPMFASVAECFGPGGAAVVLSGMGADGALGAAAMADVGAAVYAQDPDTSVVWGMPGAVSKAGLTSAILPPAEIAQFIAQCWLEDA